MTKRIIALVFVLAAAVTLAGNVVMRPLPPQPAPDGKNNCHACPLICSEVTCDNGMTYCNSCLAACAGAKNCVPGGF